MQNQTSDVRCTQHLVTAVLHNSSNSKGPVQRSLLRTGFCLLLEVIVVALCVDDMSSTWRNPVCAEEGALTKEHGNGYSNSPKISIIKFQ